MNEYPTLHEYMDAAMDVELLMTIPILEPMIISQATSFIDNLLQDNPESPEAIYGVVCFIIHQYCWAAGCSDLMRSLAPNLYEQEIGWRMWGELQVAMLQQCHEHPMIQAAFLHHARTRDLAS